MRLRAIAVMGGLVAVLGAIYFLVGTNPASPKPKTQTFVWSVPMDRLQTLAISLPTAGKREAWTKHSDHYWYFDKPNGPQVNMARWGGGIPLLLTGPQASRTIAVNATNEQLQTFGLLRPSMVIRLTLSGGRVITIDVGDLTPDQQNYYVKLAESRRVYTIDYTWRDVMERLVIDPPYPPTQSGH